jgi:AraC-like DNA-binding protein
MQVAAGLLARGDKVASVALEVGYDSEAAFSRAFKKLIGRSPKTWRDDQGLAPPKAKTSARSAADGNGRSRDVAVRSAQRGSRVPRLQRGSRARA